MGCQPGPQLLSGPGVRGDRGLLTDDEPCDLRRLGFDIIRTDAVVADLSGRKDQDLAGVAWIGEGFLISGEGRVEDDFPDTTSMVVGTEGDAPEDGSILERQSCRLGLMIIHCVKQCIPTNP